MDLDSSVVERSYVKREARGSSPGSDLYFSVKTLSPEFHSLLSFYAMLCTFFMAFLSILQ